MGLEGGTLPMAPMPVSPSASTPPLVPRTISPGANAPALLAVNINKGGYNLSGRRPSLPVVLPGGSGNGSGVSPVEGGVTKLLRRPSLKTSSSYGSGGGGSGTPSFDGSSRRMSTASATSAESGGSSFDISALSRRRSDDRRHTMALFAYSDKQVKAQRQLLCELDVEFAAAAGDSGGTSLAGKEKEKDASDDSSVGFPSSSSSAMASSKQGKHKKEKEYKERKEILREYDLPKSSKYSTVSMERFNQFFKLKRIKKKSFRETVHLLRLAIQDHRLENALYLTTTLSAEAFKSAPSNMVFAFTSAMAEGVDGVVLQFVTHEFPPDVNAPSMTMLLDHTPKEELDLVKGIIPGGKKVRKFMCPSLFMMALSYEMEDAVMLMLKASASLSDTWYGLSPLMLASYVNGHGNARIANLLLECGADPAQGIPLTLYRLMSRLKRTVVPKRDQLLSMRTMSSRLNSTGNSANGTPTLSRSTTPSKSPQPIAKADIRPPSRTTMGRSSFISMVAKAELQDPVEVDRLVIYPLDLAAAVDNRDIVSQLLSRMTLDEILLSQLSVSATTDVQVLVMLVEHGLPITQTNIQGYTAFHLAARRGDVDFLAVLKAFQFPVNLPGPGGRTALHEAVLGNQLDSVQYLLHHGAKHDAKTLDGETALDLARKMGLKDNDRLIVSLDAANSNIVVTAPCEPDVASIIASSREFRSSYRRTSSAKLDRIRSDQDLRRSERRTSLDQAKPTDASSSTVSTSSGASLNPGRFSQRRRATSTPLTETSFFTPMTSTALEVVQEQPEVAEHN